MLSYSASPRVELAADQLKSLEIPAGNNMTLSVQITRFNVPLTDITWSHEDNILTSGADRVTITNSPSLSFSPVSSTMHRTWLIPLDSGLYIANSSNIIGSGTLTFNVTVTGEL